MKKESEKIYLKHKHTWYLFSCRGRCGLAFYFSLFLLSLFFLLGGHRGRGALGLNPDELRFGLGLVVLVGSEEVDIV